MSETDKPTYAAIDVPVFVGGAPAVLACAKHHDPDQRRVIALTPTEAGYLYAQGRLTGWTPTEPDGGGDHA